MTKLILLCQIFYYFRIYKILGYFLINPKILSKIPFLGINTISFEFYAELQNLLNLMVEKFQTQNRATCANCAIGKYT